MEEHDPAVAHPGPVDFDPGGGLTACHTVAQSMAINDHVGPAIIISASGMATGGRVLHHLKRMLPDPRNTVVLCGFQAAGTRGRSLADGAKEIRMFDREVPVRADVVQLRSMSVHADSNELLAWIQELREQPEHVYAIHGEPSASAALVERLQRDLGLDASAPSGSIVSSSPRGTPIAPRIRRSPDRTTGRSAYRSVG